MKRKLLIGFMCGVIMLGLTGCGNNNESNNNINKNNNSQVEEKQEKGKIKDWNKNRTGDNLTNSDEEQDRIIYKLEKMEDGNYILFFKNTNDYGINIFADLDFYDSKVSTQTSNGTRRVTVPNVSSNTVGALVFKDITLDYDSYKMYFTVQKNEFEDGSNNIDFEEKTKDGKLKINGINNNKKELANFNATVVYYKDNKILTAVHEDNGYGGTNVVKDYPKDKDGNKLEYDKYEIYLNSAYISQ